jgi:hypothetical protein
MLDGSIDCPQMPCDFIRCIKPVTRCVCHRSYEAWHFRSHFSYVSAAPCGLWSEVTWWRPHGNSWTLWIRSGMVHVSFGQNMLKDSICWILLSCLTINDHK